MGEWENGRDGSYLWCWYLVLGEDDVLVMSQLSTMEKPLGSRQMVVYAKGTSWQKQTSCSYWFM